MTSCWSGPAKAGKSTHRDNIVGVTTGRPVLLLDDLLVALRTAEQAAQGGITCSIDPTAEGRRGCSIRGDAAHDGATRKRSRRTSSKPSAPEKIKLHDVPRPAISPACWWPPIIR